MADGTLIAVAGLAGGAGTTTLAVLLAAFAARAGRRVLLADTGGLGAGVAGALGVSASRSLPAVAAMAAAGVEPPAPLTATGPFGLRVLATPPTADDPGDEAPRAGLVRVLDDARTAHALTVLDVGTLTRPVERDVLAAADAAIYTVPASAHAAAHARAVVAAIAAAPPAALVGRRITRRDGAVGALASLAETLATRLVLVPSLDLGPADGLERALETADGALRAALEAIA